MMQHIPSRYLVAYVVLSDVVLILVALPLQRYALAAALSPSSGALLILVLLLLNALLLVVVIAAALASCGIALRITAQGVRLLRRRH